MPVTARRLVEIALALALAASARPSLAADGVLEINQTCAAGAGCFAGDAPGFPVEVAITITRPRGYALTSDLAVPNANTDAIRVTGTAHGVSIDLHGFAILGPTACTGAPATCVGAGSGNAIDAIGTSITGVRVRNGHVRGMGSTGILLGDACQVEGLTVVGNGGSGISVGAGCRVENAIAAHNGVLGISTGAGSSVERSTAYGNKLSGVEAGSGTVRGVAGYQNGFAGILAGINTTAVHNATAQNTGDGISCPSGCVIRGNAAWDNGDDGISCIGGGCAIQANAASYNADYGIALSSDSAYLANTAANNATGAVNGGVGRGGNYCAGTGVATPPNCP